MSTQPKLLALIEMVGQVEEWIVDANCDPNCDAYRGPNGTACSACTAKCLVDNLTESGRSLPPGEETLSQRLWRLSQGNVHPERAEAYRRAAVMALDAEGAACRVGRGDAGPQINDEMVTAYRDAWAALPVPATPAERVRAGLAAVAPLLSLGQAAEQTEDDLHHWVCCDPNTTLRRPRRWAATAPKGNPMTTTSKPPGHFDTDTPILRLARVVRAFRDMGEDATVAAVATSDGGASHLTYGDLSALLEQLMGARDRVDRIAGWHSRETAEAGMVGDFCTECGQRWPCDTRRMADGTYEDTESTR